jgi:hypothetical protein
MPMLVWLYLIALLDDQTSATCAALVEALETVSHDCLMRLLWAHYSGQTLLEHACRTRFVWEQGDRILDNTAIPRAFGTAIDSHTWPLSSQERCPEYGFSLVLRVLSDGTLRIPLGLRLWRKGAPRHPSWLWNG